MRISEMTDDERHTFGALVRLMVGADGSVSLEESADLKEAADQLGSDDFWTLVRETAGMDYPAEAIQAKATKITRKEVQETIYAVLFNIASAGSIVGSEGTLLDRLGETWGLGGGRPLAE